MVSPLLLLLFVVVVVVGCHEAPLCWQLLLLQWLRKYVDKHKAELLL